MKRRRKARKTWREAGLYVWRTRKPNAILGLPIIGRHFAYGGETGSRYHRDLQHVRGGGTYNAVAKSWSDLKPKVYPIPCFFPNNARARQFQEKLMIRLLLPVYNVEHNRGNPRRITPAQAKQQRWARDQFGFSYKLVSSMVGWAVYALVALAVYWVAGHVWQ